MFLFLFFVLFLFLLLKKMKKKSIPGIWSQRELTVALMWLILAVVNDNVILDLVSALAGIYDMIAWNRL